MCVTCVQSSRWRRVISLCVIRLFQCLRYLFDVLRPHRIKRIRGHQTSDESGVGMLIFVYEGLKRKWGWNVDICMRGPQTKVGLECWYLYTRASNESGAGSAGMLIFVYEGLKRKWGWNIDLCIRGPQTKVGLDPLECWYLYTRASNESGAGMLIFVYEVLNVYSSIFFVISLKPLL